jgi:hypothetical protein
MSLATHLSDYSQLCQHHHEQMAAALQQLQTQIDEQLAALRALEQPLIEAQSELLTRLRTSIESDARVLLPLPQFGAAIIPLLGHRLYGAGGVDSFSVHPDPQQWFLNTLSIPVQIQNYEVYRDDWAYNDERHYTQYGYRFTAGMDAWQHEVSAATVSLYPGNRVECRRESLRHQHPHILYNLLVGESQHRIERDGVDFAFLALQQAERIQLKQELSALLAYVGQLFYTHSIVESFRYPIAYLEDE